ncbi:MAG: ribosome maturation factor RimM [Clostridia bacterium]|nr:ribosome maturation factor RimM [Clostridia bacterium]
MVEYLEIGKIANTHGVRGDMKIIPLTDDPRRFEDLSWVFIEKDNKLNRFDIQGVKFLKGMVLLKLKGIDDMTSAEAFRNCFLKIDRANAVKLPEDSFFICDILGSEVYDMEHGLLGVLEDVLKTGSNDVYVVKRENKKDILIPALKAVVKEVCVKEKRILVNLPEGLVDNEI